MDEKKPRKPRTETPEKRRERIAQLKPYRPGYGPPAEHTPEVYESMIAAMAAGYPDYFYPGLTPEAVQEELDDPQAFRGLLLYLYNHIFKPAPKTSGRRYGSNLDYSDTELLDFIFSQYLLLCAKYHQIPTIDNFLIMTGIDQNTVNTWKNGKSRNYDKYINNSIDIDNSNGLLGNVNNGLSHRELLEKWNIICKAALVDQAGRKNSIGSIFLLKAVHGFRDSSPVQLEVSTAGPRESAAAIAARHAGETPPQLPDESPEN